MTALPARLALAAGAGLAAALAFEPFAWAWLLPLAVAGVTVAAVGARPGPAFATGTAFGLVFMLVLLPWLQVIGTDAWVALSLLEALFYGLVGAATAVLTRLPLWPVWAATVWVGAEQLRGSVPFGGFPWGRLAFATIDTPVAAATGYLGAAGVTFLVALLGTTLAWAAGRVRRTPAVAVASVAGAAALASGFSLVPVADASSREPNPFRVAIVQGNVPGEGMDAFAERRAVLDNHLRATRELAERYADGSGTPPDLVIWPESSTDIDPFSDPTVYADISAVVDELGVPILVGAMVAAEQPGEVYNQGIVWEPGSGPGQRYSKRHPVPFGEYIPLRDQFAPLIRRLDQIPRDMVPGTRPGVMRMNGITFAEVICFEVAYDDLVREAVTDETRALVVQTNNATYMGTGQVEQQFAISRLRAIETGRPVLVAATNGVSGIVAPDGRVVARAPVQTRTVLEAELDGPGVRPPALDLGLWVKSGLVTTAAGSVLAAVLLGYRRRTSRDEAARETANVAG